MMTVAHINKDFAKEQKEILELKDRLIKKWREEEKAQAQKLKMKSKL